jgi:hypothetical protein
MRTEDLVRVLAADTAPAPAPWPRLVRGLAAGVLAVAAVAVPALGLRTGDPGGALAGGWVTLKQLLPVLLAIGAFGAALRLARPEGRPGPWGAVLAAVPMLLLVAVAAELAALPRAAWMPAMMGQTSRFCLVAITLMALPPLAGVLWALRAGASTRPAASGALAGLLAGGTAAALYAIHCIEDSPLFYAVWYGLAVLLTTAMGAALGRRLLRW